MGELKITKNTSTSTVLILFFFLMALIGLLILLYKRLNRETDDQYSIHRLVYQPGGLRDRVRRVALHLESHLGVRLWPRTGSDGEGEEMQEIRCEEGQGAEVSSLTSEGDGKEDDESACIQGEDMSDKASSDGSDVRREVQEKQEEDQDSDQDSDVISLVGQESGGAGIVINLNQFSGNATWSDEQDSDGNVTAL